MNKSRLCKGLLLLLCVIGTTAYGQKKEIKAFKESFNVNPETILDIDTSNADIQFETWNKDEIEIEATIALEGATAAEAKNYFENERVEIVGNSKRIKVSTSARKNWNFGNTAGDFGNYHFDNGFSMEIDELMGSMNQIAGDSIFLEFAQIHNMPPMPPIPSTNFDYKAFEKDGQKYLKKWQSEFKEGFGKEYQEKMKVWQQEVQQKQERSSEERAKLLENRAEARNERLEKRAEERAEKMEKRNEERAERFAKLREQRWRLLNTGYRNDSVRNFFKFNDSLTTNRPNRFYFSSDGRNRNFKVKKTIRIKMPKGNKIKMNVRHGDVKLAANTLNIDADLSYSNLLAFEIDGAETNVRASYSPVSVEKWNLGQLQTEYSDAVNLQEVIDLRLTATSSEVTINRLLHKAMITNDFGPLKILSISNDFSNLDVSLENAELNCQLPQTNFSIYVNSNSSKVALPVNMQIERTQNGNTVVHKGFLKNKSSAKGIVINAKYSDVVFN